MFLGKGEEETSRMLGSRIHKKSGATDKVQKQNKLESACMGYIPSTLE